MEKLFLLDAYALIYRAYYAFINSPRMNSKGFNTSAVLGFVNTLEEVLTKENPSHIGVAFDPKGGTFRHEIYKEYKAQREETPEVISQSVPVIKQIIEAYNIPVLEVAGFEADDVIGTLSKKADESGIQTYMLTPDKDYCQLVTDRVNIYRPRHGGGYETMTPATVLEKYGITDTSQIIDLLGLMGDSSDNIPGCPGVGPKTAQKLIEEFGSVEKMLDQTDKLKGALKEKVMANAENIRFSKMLATIRTDVPIELDLQALKRKSPDTAKLRAIFEELEMRSLMGRVLASAQTKIEEPALFTEEEKTPAAKPGKKPADDGFSGDLFGLFADNGPEIFENSNLKDIKTVQHSYHLVENEDDMKALAAKFLALDFYCFDTETTGTDPIQAKIVGMSLSAEEGTAYYIPFKGTEEEKQARLEIFRPMLENSSSLKIGQNMKYDILVLARYGITVGGPLFDTMVAHYLLQPEQRHGMDYLAEAYLKYSTVRIEELIGEKGKGQKNMADLSPAMISDYACEDADVTLKLKNVFEPMLKEQGIEKLFHEIEMPLVRVLAYMERNGARIDTNSLAETSRMFTERMQAIERDIFEEVGFSFNILSPKQVGEVLFDKLKIIEKPKKTKSGQYVTSEDVLESLRSKSPVVEKILQYRGLKKLVGTYVDALPALINPETGKIHTSYNQAVTATGRLSSSSPNLQNIPIRDEDGKEVRKAFIPDPGCKFFSADYSQIELRIMAHLSKDRNMTEDFRTGEDIHAATAAKVFRKPIEEVTKAERSKAKTANFGIIYGISAFGLAERMGVSRTEAKNLIDDYFVTYPDIKAYIEKQIMEAREKGYIETLMGRRRYLPDIGSHNATVRGYAERNAVNAPIQGSAADIIKIAMISIYERFMKEGLKSTMILQVHDELNFNVVPGEEDTVSRIVLEEMQNAYPLDVPLIADCGWGSNWLEAH